MAQTPSVLTSNVVNTAGATVTASVTPNSDGAVLVIAAVRHATTPFTDTTTVSGNSLTWAKIGSVITGNYLITAFVGYGGSPSSGAITITFSQNPASGRYVVIEQRGYGANTTNPVNHAWTGNGTGTTGTITFASPSPSDGAQTLMGAFMHAAAELVTPDATGATWTERHDASTTSIALEVQELIPGGDFTNTATWATSSDWGAVGWEMHNTSHGVTRVTSAPAHCVGGLVVDVSPDEEGVTVAGKPSGVWAIVGGPGA